MRISTGKAERRGFPANSFVSDQVVHMPADKPVILGFLTRPVSLSSCLSTVTGKQLFVDMADRDFYVVEAIFRGPLGRARKGSIGQSL